MSNEQPTVEELFIREAMKHLTEKQRKVWEYYIFEKYTQDEIARILGKKRTTIQTQIAQCEKAITKWCKSHQFVYEMLKAEQPVVELDDIPNGQWQADAWSHKTPIRTNKGYDD